MCLTCSVSGVYSHSSHLSRRERYLGRFGTWGWERRLRAGANVALRSREYLGIRPAPLSGSATEAGWTGTGKRREIAEGCQVPGSADQGYYAATERREALPCASVSRRSGK